ncbi:Prenyltransferase fsdK, partial [Frankliniella fusca]
ISVLSGRFTWGSAPPLSTGLCTRTELLKRTKNEEALYPKDAQLPKQMWTSRVCEYPRMLASIS